MKNRSDTIYTTQFSTPLGVMFAASFKDELIMFIFFDKVFIEKELKTLQKILKVEKITQNDTVFENLKIQIDEYFNKKREKFDIPFRVFGTPFQVKCWEALLQIPYGKTISYKKQAQNIKNEKAFRAVANSNSKNLIDIIIPCHRVIASDGKLGGYSCGVDKKLFLLKLEQNIL